MFFLCTWGTAGWSVCPVGWWDEWPIFLSGCGREWGEPERVPESWHTPVVPSRHQRSCWTPACSRCLCRFDKWRGRRAVNVVWLHKWTQTMELCCKSPRPPRLRAEHGDIYQAELDDRVASARNETKTHCSTQKYTHRELHVTVLTLVLWAWWEHTDAAAQQRSSSVPKQPQHPHPGAHNRTNDSLWRKKIQRDKHSGRLMAEIRSQTEKWQSASYPLFIVILGVVFFVFPSVLSLTKQSPIKNIDWHQHECSGTVPSWNHILK